MPSITTSNNDSLDVTTAIGNYGNVLDKIIVGRGNASKPGLVTIDEKDDVSENQYGYFDHDLEVLGILSSFLGVLVLVGNIFILYISKYASGGKSPTLVFVRSLCVADAIAGVFAVSKGVQLMLQPKWVNCFLGESVLFTTIVGSIWILLIMIKDCLSKITNPIKYDIQQDKRVIISVMIIIWNVAFIIGFLPQIGWHSRDLGCIFFHYYSSSYLFFLAGCVIVSIFACAIYQIQIQRTVRLRNKRHRLSFVDETRQYHASVAEITIILTRFDLLLDFVFYIPIMVYLVVHCGKCVLYEDTRKESRDVLFFYPLILAKGVCALFLHASRTPQILKVLKDLSKCKLSRTKLVTHQDSVRSTRTLQSGTSSIYSIARRYSMNLSGTLPKSASSSVRSSRRGVLPEMDPTYRESSRSMCTNCGHKVVTVSTDDRNSLSRSVSAPAGQSQSHLIYRHGQVSDLSDNGQINPVYEGPGRTRSDLLSVTAANLSSKNTGEYRKSFVQTHMFKPQYLVCKNESNDPKLLPVPRQRSVPTNYCPVHGVQFKEETKVNVIPEANGGRTEAVVSQVEQPVNKPNQSLTTDL